jgi:general secretion pathway protein D
VKFENDLDLNKIKLSDTLALISKSTGVTIVADHQVKDMEIDLYINKGQSLREVLDLLEKSNNLIERKEGKNYIISTKSRIKTGIFGRVVDENKQGIRGVKVTLNGNEFKPIESVNKGKFIFDNIRPGIYIMKFEKNGYFTTSEVVEVNENKISQLEVIIQRKNVQGKNIFMMDEGLREKTLGTDTTDNGEEILTERVELKYGYANDIREIVYEVLGKNITVTAFPKHHLLVIKGKKEDVETAKKLIDDLDREVIQIRITAQVLDTTENLFEDLGFQWLFSNKADDINNANPGTSIGILPANALGIVTGTSTINFVDIFNDGKNLLELSINMLQQTEDLSISSVPSVVVVNGKEAKFKVTEEVIVGEREIADDDNNRVTEPIFEEAGNIFTVTPTVRKNKDGEYVIILDILSEVSGFNLSRDGTYNNKGGSKIQSNINTKIQVRNGDVIFIGGLKKTKIEEGVDKVPILGDIPGLGLLFRNTTTKNSVRQVYIQITAEIVTTGNQNTERDMKDFKENPGTTGEYRKVYPDLRKYKEKI